MKIIKTNQPVDAAEYQAYLDQKLNPLFQKQRMLDLSFDIVLREGAIEIINTELYDGFLFRLEKAGDNEWHIIKSEHYTDDVNVLTLEDIMNNLLMEFPGRQNIEFIDEGS